MCNNSKLEIFKNMGIFNLSDFTRIRSQDQSLTPSVFVKLLEHLRIAAPFQQLEGGEIRYFLPCALTHVQVKQSDITSIIPPLIVTFQCGYCPKGLFGTLITYLINNEMKSDFEWKLVADKIYRDEVCFQVGPYDTVTLRFLPTHLEVLAECYSDLRTEHDCTEEDVCQEVRQSVEKGIKTVTSAINYINAQHSFTFYCTSENCSDDPHPAKLNKHKGKLCTLTCYKCAKPFRLPSNHEKWQLDALSCPKHDLNGLENLKKCHSPSIISQLSNCAAKWREIGTYLDFHQDELDIIQATPMLQSGAPHLWLSTLISKWIEWAPGDSRGSTKYANLQDLKSAVSKAGYGVTAKELSLKQETIVESGQSSGNKRKPTTSEEEPNLKKPRLAEQ